MIMNNYFRQSGDAGHGAAGAATTATTDRGRKYSAVIFGNGRGRGGGVGDGGGDDNRHWQAAAAGRYPRKPNNKKFTGFRKFGGRPDDGTTVSRCYEPVRRTDETRSDAVQWESMTKHFSR